eukprot:gnl/TRDRNA2_/TRDRNA2_27657_c0_seq2.p2 gnl/TRDRNA2_/TRDRNA2_27657_c0~~gnl/TRDRNA2_/TRDRNA2_27657_c0_seq2.p2  ORF type:complete len:191 (-),score=19.72 gnl/TRDRNA2_/TRDRNA2_27657_c0_seq2:7-579(-)
MWSDEGTTGLCPERNLSALLGCVGAELTKLAHDLVFFLGQEAGSAGIDLSTAVLECLRSMALERADCSRLADWHPGRGLSDFGIEFASRHPRSAALITGQMDLALLVIIVSSMFVVCVCSIWRLRHCVRRQREFEALFFPDKSGAHVQRIAASIKSAERRVLVAMYTLTDNLLSDALLQANQRGVDDAGS